jgi:FAD binding domain/Berberine and berberine like
VPSALTTRRQFARTCSFAAAAVCARARQASPETDALSIDPADLRKFAGTLGGRLILQGAPGYEDSRLIFNRAFNQRPAVIVRCSKASDVARALEFAQVHHLPVAVRGGGHSRAGFGVCEGGLVIDFADMKRIQVDPKKRGARAEAGSLVRDFDGTTSRFGLAATMGGCLTVGIAGLTLGGGEGFLMPKLGAACDNLVAAHLITVDGRELEVNQESNPDLFWALRGGGGNFGVVTSFEYRLHPVGTAISGTLAYSGAQLADALALYAKFIRACPDDANVFAEILRAADGPKVLLHLCCLGEPGFGNDLLKPLRTTIKPSGDKVESMTYAAAQATGFLPAPFAHFQTNLFVPDLTDVAIEIIRLAVYDAPRQFRVLIIPFYGAVVRVPKEETAFALRSFGFEVDMLGSWDTPSGKEEAVRWVKALRDRLKPFAQGTYVNQLGETSEELVRAAYGQNYVRLAAIKKKFDPTNVLRINQNITPI